MRVKTKLAATKAKKSLSLLLPNCLFAVISGTLLVYFKKRKR